MLVALRDHNDHAFTNAVAILRPLLPHLRQAALLHKELACLRAQLDTFKLYLDRYPHPFLLTDAQAQVIYANAAATETASMNDGLAIASGRLSVKSCRGQTAFTKAVEEAARGSGVRVHWLDVERSSQKPPFRLFLMPLSGSPLFSPESRSAPIAILILDTESRREPDPALLCLLYSLTPAEARVASKLAIGRSAEQIAEALGVSLETVRTHIRRALSKTSTGRQGELISLLLCTTPFGRF
jgi:DNA-binding CsgD family transcriptional regulator